MKSSTKHPVARREFKLWRDSRIIDADVSELRDLRGPELTAQRCQEIETVLLERGASVSPEAVIAVEELWESRASAMAGIALRRILLTLPPCPSVIALRLVVLGQQTESYRQLAAEAGCSHQAVLKAIRALGIEPSDANGAKR